MRDHRWSTIDILAAAIFGVGGAAVISLFVAHVIGQHSTPAWEIPVWAWIVSLGLVVVGIVLFAASLISSRGGVPSAAPTQPDEQPMYRVSSQPVEGNATDYGAVQTTPSPSRRTGIRGKNSKIKLGGKSRIRNQHTGIEADNSEVDIGDDTEIS